MRSARLTASRGTPMRAARRSISARAIFGRSGTVGSAWKVDSCSVTAITAHRFDVLGSISNAANAAYMSAAQPARSEALAGSSSTMRARTSDGRGRKIAGRRSPAHPISAATPRAATVHVVLELAALNSQPRARDHSRVSER
jgi:hypothetical protein